MRTQKYKKQEEPKELTIWDILPKCALMGGFLTAFVCAMGIYVCTNPPNQAFLANVTEFRNLVMSKFGITCTFHMTPLYTLVSGFAAGCVLGIISIIVGLALVIIALAIYERYFEPRKKPWELRR